MSTLAPPWFSLSLVCVQYMHRDIVQLGVGDRMIVL